MPAADPRGFASDNHSGAHPEVLEAIARANVGHAGSYGEDGWTARVDELFQEHFGPEAVGFPVFNGTAANVLAIDALTRPHEAVICVEGAHIDVDECGAPERWAGVKLLKVEAGATASSTPADLRALGGPARRSAPQPAAGRLDRPGDRGGHRLLGRGAAGDRRRGPRAGDATCTSTAPGSPTPPPRSASRSARSPSASRPTSISLGATKNGGLVGDAVVFLDPGLGKGFEYIRKQGMQLASKMRFLSAQFEALLGDGELWRRNAEAANAMAARLGAGVEAIDGVELAPPGQANGVFARLAAPGHRPAAAASSPASTPSTSGTRAPTSVRWMCSWDTTEEDVDALIAAVRSAVGA